MSQTLSDGGALRTDANIIAQCKTASGGRTNQIVVAECIGIIGKHHAEIVDSCRSIVIVT